jgi:hypothetical protein
MVGGTDKAQVDLGARVRRDGVDGLAAADRADIAADAVGQVGQRMQHDDLLCEFFDGADAVSVVVAGMRRLAGDIEAHEDAALASGDDAAAWPAGLAVEHGARRACLLHDQFLRGRRAYLFIGGEKRGDRRRRRGESLERGDDEGIDRQSRLHIGAARAGRLAVANAERASDGFALPEHGVAMAHEQDRRVAGARTVADTGANGVAETLIGNDIKADVVAREKAAQLCADSIDADLIIGAAVDIYERRHEPDHGVAQAREPVEHRGFFLESEVIRFPFATRSPH